MQPLMISRDRDQLGLDGGPVTARPLDLAPLVGTWVNVDGHAAGIARMEIADRGGLLAVRVFGVLAVGAEQVDWGSGGLKSKASTQASGDQAEPSGSPPVDWGRRSVRG